jgi:hypothetical protein
MSYEVALEQLQNMSGIISKLDDVNEVECGILATESISRADVQTLEDLLERSMTTRVSVEEYTQQRSPVNYRYAMRVLSDHVVALESEFQTALVTFRDVTVLELMSGIRECIETYIPAHRQTMVDAYTSVAPLISGLATSREYVYPYDGGFQDITRIALDQLDFTKTPTHTDTGEGRAVYQLWSPLRVKEYIHSTIAGAGYQMQGSQYPDAIIDIQCVGQMLQAAAAPGYAEDLISILNAQLDILETVGVETVDVDRESIHGYVRKNALVLANAIEAVQTVVSITSSLTLSAPSVLMLLDQI